ncbi:oxalate:formate antiporter-like isoform x1 [Plakobranchus ocellatus]|uniref:Oxalate:formate antiporter-like isoform x1 n=1 Tax=Plakobranchus ocellatus TaxID=259542 RepID=A0AAV3YXN1_9GAST|nr:oxalate:formate antiporter-like isoform x1 [Plakobranchus ocellatus]
MATTRGGLRKYCSIVGAHFIRAPLSFMWIYGNLSAYTDSYFRFSCYPKCSDCDSQWLLSLYIAGTLPGFFMVKPLVKAFGLTWTGIIAMAITNMALLGSAWSMQVSIAWTAVMYGVLVGPGAGISSTVIIQTISEWAPERAAVLLATTSGMSTLLAVGQNQIITAFVNPENLQPDAKIGPRTYFSQPEILERVPRVLIIYGAMTLGLQMIGYLLITDPSNRSPDFSSETTALAKVSTEVEELVAHGQGNSFYLTEKNQSNKGYGSDCESNKNIEILDVSNHLSQNPCGNSNAETIEEKVVTNLRSQETYSYTPKEVLRSPLFYAVAFFGIAMEYGILLVANFYKNFALLYIHNDKFLTLVGTLVPIISTCSRVVFGIFMDKDLLTLKDVTIIGLSINSVLCAFWYLSPRVSEILYMFLILVLSGAQGLMYVVLPTSALRLYGPTHLLTNFGLVTSSTVIGSILSPIINSPLLHALGWRWVFTAGSIFNLLVLCYVTVTKFNLQIQ